MILHFPNFETDILCDAEKVSILQIADRVLFANIVQSLISKEGSEAKEPYLILEDNRELKCCDHLLVLLNPFSLPWRERNMITVLHNRISDLVSEDEQVKEVFEQAGQKVLREFGALAFQLQGSYDFSLEWDSRKFLKAFDYSVQCNSDSLLDNLISFLEVASDLFPEKLIVLVNIKLFLNSSELIQLYEEAISLKIRLLLLETVKDSRVLIAERKMVIDQHFLENF